MSGAHLKAHLRRADSRNARTKSQTRGVVLTALYENSEHEKSLRDQLKIHVDAFLDLVTKLRIR